jgi:hypothetical protein
MRLGRHNQASHSRCRCAAISLGAGNTPSASAAARLLPARLHTTIAFSSTTSRGRSQALRPTLLKTSSPQFVSSMSAPVRREWAARLCEERRVGIRRPLRSGKGQTWTTGGAFGIR